MHVYTHTCIPTRVRIDIHKLTSVCSLEEWNKCKLFPCIQVVAASAANLFRAP